MERGRGFYHNKQNGESVGCFVGTQHTRSPTTGNSNGISSSKILYLVEHCLRINLRKYFVIMLCNCQQRLCTSSFTMFLVNAKIMKMAVDQLIVLTFGWSAVFTPTQLCGSDAREGILARTTGQLCTLLSQWIWQVQCTGAWHPSSSCRLLRVLMWGCTNFRNEPLGI